MHEAWRSGFLEALRFYVKLTMIPISILISSYYTSRKQMWSYHIFFVTYVNSSNWLKHGGRIEALEFIQLTSTIGRE